MTKIGSDLNLILKVIKYTKVWPGSTLYCRSGTSNVLYSREKNQNRKVPRLKCSDFKCSEVCSACSLLPRKAPVWGDGLKNAVLAACTACVREGRRGLLGIYGEEAVEVLKKEIRGGGRREAPAWWYEDCWFRAAALAGVSVLCGVKGAKPLMQY